LYNEDLLFACHRNIGYRGFPAFRSWRITVDAHNFHDDSPTTGLAAHCGILAWSFKDNAIAKWAP
jgi:hypothetical protein